MREYKFRAWDKRFKRMVYDSPMAILFLNDSDHELMQYTGLHDKNGKEIYEGDIVNGESDYGKVIGEVNWEDSFAGWAIGNTRMSAFRLLTCKVIGDIYSNPELLGK